MSGIILLRGGGDLASGTALRLFRAGLHLVITELPQPLAVRRTVSFAQAVYSRQIVIEGVTARLTLDLNHAHQLLDEGVLPVLVDPQADCRRDLNPVVLIDGRMTKHPPDLGKDTARMVIGLGPGFTAGENCHAVIETRRGPNLGRVIWDGPAEADTGLPDSLAGPRQTLDRPSPGFGSLRVRKPQTLDRPSPGFGSLRVRKPQGVEAPRQEERVLRAPADGVLRTHAQIGEHLSAGQVLAEVAGQSVTTAFAGVLRGLLMDGFTVTRGLKIGDVDPRDDPRLCQYVSDKSLAVAGGVLEAILSRADVRSQLWAKIPDLGLKLSEMDQADGDF